MKLEMVNMAIGIVFMLLIFITGGYNGFSDDKHAFGSLVIVFLVISCTGYGVGAAIKGFIEIFK